MCLTKNEAVFSGPWDRNPQDFGHSKRTLRYHCVSRPSSCLVMLNLICCHMVQAWPMKALLDSSIERFSSPGSREFLWWLSRMLFHRRKRRAQCVQHLARLACPPQETTDNFESFVWVFWTSLPVLAPRTRRGVWPADMGDDAQEGFMICGKMW